VPVVTVDNTDVVLEEGTEVSLTNMSTLITRMELVSAVSGGSGIESTESLVNRTIDGITAKIPSGKAHIHALLSEYSDISVYDLAVVGMGDAEMLRDKNNVFLLGTGGRVDIYCKTAPLPATITVERTATTTDGITWTMFVPRDVAPGWYFISKINKVGSANTLTDPHSMEVTFLSEQVEHAPEVFSGVTARYSPYQTARVSFKYPGTGSSTAQFQVSFVYMPQLEGLQEFINAPATRNRQQDNLIKAAVPAYISMDLMLRSTSDPTGLDLDEISMYIANYINNLPIGRGFLSVSDLAVVINKAYSGVTLSFPASLAMSVYMPDGTIHEETTTEGVLNMHEDTEQGVSSRNTSFFCRPGDITLTLED
jgi:hypothetical protein